MNAIRYRGGFTPDVRHPMHPKRRTTTTARLPSFRTSLGRVAGLVALLLVAPIAWAGYPSTDYESPEDCGNDKSLSDPINLATGDFQYRHEDLRIPGVGFDFVLTRTYRSRSGIWSLWAGHDEVFPGTGFDARPLGPIPPSPVGNNWDHSYNIFVMPMPATRYAGSISSNDSIGFFSGDGRMNELRYRHHTPTPPTGFEYYAAREHYLLLEKNLSTGQCIIRFGDGKRYEFVPLDSAYGPIQGKISQIVDRYDNTMTFSYIDPATSAVDAQGRLRAVTDTRGNTITFEYDSIDTHMLRSVIDHTNRVIDYTHEAVTIDRGVGFDDIVKYNLRTVSLPAVDWPDDQDVDGSNAFFEIPVVHRAYQARPTWTYIYADEMDEWDAGDRPDFWEYIWWAGALETIVDPRGNTLTRNEYSVPYARAHLHGNIPASHPIAIDEDYRRPDNYRVIRQQHGDGEYEYTYDLTNPTPSTLFGRNPAHDTYLSEPATYSVWVHNRAGHVKRLDYGRVADLAFHPVRRADYTGVVPPDSTEPWGPAPEFVEDPDWELDYLGPIDSPKVRTGEADVYEDGGEYGQLYSYDRREIIRTLPSGVRVDTYYEDAGTVDPRFRGFMKVRILSGGVAPANRKYAPPSSSEGKHPFGASSYDDYTEIKQTWTPIEGLGASGCGCGGFSFAGSYEDPMGNLTVYDYDTQASPPKGNLIAIHHPEVPETESDSNVEAFEYNEYGQRVEHTNLSSGESARLDTSVYYDNTSDMEGYLHQSIVDDGGEELTTTYEYDAAGNVVSVTDPRGYETTYAVNQLNQIVRMIARGDPGTTDDDVQYDRFYDASGNLVREDKTWRDAVGEALGDGVVTTIYEYDVLDRLTRVLREVAPYNAALPSEATGLGGQLDATSPNDLTESSSFIIEEYEYDLNDHLVLVRKGEAVRGRQVNNVVKYEYDERDLLFRETRGWWEPEAEPDVVDHPLVTEYAYDANGLLAEKTVLGDPAVEGGRARTWLYEMDEFNRLRSVTAPEGTKTVFELDQASNVLATVVYDTTTDPDTLMSETTTEYDERNRPYSVTRTWNHAGDPLDDPDELVTSTTSYFENGSAATVSDPNGNTTSYAYDSVGRLEAVFDLIGNFTVFGYDENSNRTTVFQEDYSVLKDRSQEQFGTSFAYDAHDRLIGVTDGIGNATAYEHDNHGNRTKMVDARGNETTYTYDSQDRQLTQTIDLDGEPDIEIRQDWDHSGRLIGQRDANGNWTAYAYDGTDRTVATRMADGTVSQIGSGLDEDSWEPGDSDSAPYIEDWSAAAFVTGYELNGDPTEVRDANGTVVEQEFDHNGRLTERTITPATGVIGTTTESYLYDGLNRLITASNSDATVTRTYDSLSRVESETVTLTGVALDPATTFTYTYDAAGNVLKTNYDGVREVWRLFDSLNRAVWIGECIAANPANCDEPDPEETTDWFTIAQYGYLGPDRVEVRAYGNGTESLYQYNGQYQVNDGSGFDPSDNDTGDYGVGQVRRIVHQTSGGSPLVFDQRSFLWDPNQSKTQRLNETTSLTQNRFRHDYTYDHADRLRETQITNVVTSASLTPVEYTLDGVHNRVRVEMDNPGSGLYRSSYEMYTSDPPSDKAVNQYTLGPDSRFEYDANGNLIEQRVLQPGDLNLSGGVNAADFNVLSGNLGTTTSLWGEGDINGDGVVTAADFNLLVSQWGQSGPPPDTLKYDWQNRLIEFEDASEDLTYTYTYDVFGRRLRKVTTETSTEDFVRDERFAYGGKSLWQLCLVRETTDADPETAAWDSESTIVHGAVYIDEVVQLVHQVDPGVEAPPASAFYYHHDDLFSVMARTDASGDVIDRYDYSDYGSPTFMDEDGNPDSVPARHEMLGLFQGREWDADIAMYQFRYRWMDPAKGRFVTRDPIGTWGDIGNAGNDRTFVHSTPFVHMDPFGLAASKGPFPGDPAPPPEPPYNPRPRPRTIDDMAPRRTHQFTSWDDWAPATWTGRPKLQDWDDFFRRGLYMTPSPTGVCVVSCHGDRGGPKIGSDYLEKWLEDMKRTAPGMYCAMMDALREKCPKGIVFHACGDRHSETDTSWRNITRHLNIPIYKPTDGVRWLPRDRVLRPEDHEERRLRRFNPPDSAYPPLVDPRRDSDPVLPTASAA